MANYNDIQETIRLDEVLVGLGIDVTHIRNGNHWGACPLHDDRDAHFSVEEDLLIWNCYVCNEGGRLPKLVARVLEFEDDDWQTAWQKAVEWLVPYSDAELVDDSDYEEHQKRLSRIWNKIEEKPRAARERVKLPVYSERLLDRLEPVDQDLLAKWNIRQPHTCRAFRMGIDHKRSRGEYVGPALVVPHYFKGKLVGYQERWLDHGTEGFPRWVPKYTNSDDFPKKETLFNYDRAIRGGEVIVVESAMSVIRLFELGYDAVATFGAGASDQQLRLLSAFSRGVILSGDNDDTGRKALEKMRQGLFDVPVKILPFVEQEKGDLADLPDDEVDALVAAATTT